MKRSLGLLLLFFASNAHASEAEEVAGPPKRTVTVVADAWQPLQGIAAAHGELRMSRDVGLGLWLGAGAIRRDNVYEPAYVMGRCGTHAPCEHNAYFGAAVQTIYYAIGTFSGVHSWQLGAELAFAKEWGDGNRTVVTPGILSGYKLVTASGFTLNPHVAFGYAIGDERYHLASRVVLGVGWSF